MEHGVHLSACYKQWWWWWSSVLHKRQTTVQLYICVLSVGLLRYRCNIGCIQNQQIRSI